MHRKKKWHPSRIRVGPLGAGKGILILATLVALGWSSWLLHASQPLASPSHMNGMVQHTRPNTAPPPGLMPDGMVWIPGGEFSMGAPDPYGNEMNDVGMLATRDSRPIHRVYVDGFWMDKTEVTNAQFTRFVKATGYVTVAERTPRAEDFPGAPLENLVAGSVVFSPPAHAVPLDNHFR